MIRRKVIRRKASLAPMISPLNSNSLIKSKVERELIAALRAAAGPDGNRRAESRDTQLVTFG